MYKKKKYGYPYLIKLSSIPPFFERTIHNGLSLFYCFHTKSLAYYTCACEGGIGNEQPSSQP